MKAAILASSHYFRAMDDGPAPDLEPALRAATRVRHRRIDRFIQLSLLGAARCAARAPSGTGPTHLYMGSGVGPVGNNIVVQTQMFRDRQLPGPFQFVNTLGSSATFYVAKELGLDGQAWWAGRRGASLEALLELAGNDLEAGLCARALVGVVEECPAPLEEQRRRVGAPPGAPLAEGSHWLLLGAESEGGVARLSLDFSRDPGEWPAAAATARRAGEAVALGPGPPAEFAGRLGATWSGRTEPFHDSLAAARLTAWLDLKQAGRLIMLCGSPGWYARLGVETRER